EGQEPPGVVRFSGRYVWPRALSGFVRWTRRVPADKGTAGEGQGRSCPGVRSLNWIPARVSKLSCPVSLSKLTGKGGSFFARHAGAAGRTPAVPGAKAER